MSGTTTSKTATGSRVIVGVADMQIVDAKTPSLITYALGSCIGVTIWDPVVKIGGMLHFMLPSAKSNPDKADGSPAMFADTGVPMLFREAYAKGAVKERLVVTAAGGAEVLAGNGHFRIGHRNRTILRKIFWKAGVLLKAEDTGGSDSRTMTLDIETGEVRIKSQGKETPLWTA